MPSETELFLILAARAAFVRDVVQPALGRGEIFLADRFDLSTFAYQGHGRGLDLEEVRRLNRFATGGLRPDLYLVLDLPAEVGLERKQSGRGRDRIERESQEFFTRVRDGYLALAEEDGAHIVPAHGSAEEVQVALQGILQETFPETFSAS
jgi:dTMP kinase